MRVVIVGAGIIGAACAYELAKREHEVVVIDAGRAGQGASFGNAGWICPSESGPVPAPGMIVQGLKWMLHSDSPLYIKPRASIPFVRFLLHMAAKCNGNDYREGMRANINLFAESFEAFDQWQHEGVAFEMHRDGLLMAYLGQAKYEHALHDLDIVQAAGLDPEPLQRDAVRSFEPALNDAVYGGVYFPHERAIRSETLTPGLLQAAIDRGAVLREECAFSGVERDGRRVTAVRTSQGPIACDAIVVAAGVWTANVARAFGAKLAIEPGKGYSIEYAQAPVKLRAMTSFTERKVVATPLGASLRLAGTMEFAGYNTAVNQVRANAILRGPTDFLRGWSAPTPNAPAWNGFRPMTPDSLSMIGRLGAHANAYVASGHGMYGVTLAPATATAVVEMVESGLVPERLRPFDPQRF